MPMLTTSTLAALFTTLPSDRPMLTTSTMVALFTTLPSDRPMLITSTLGALVITLPSDLGAAQSQVFVGRLYLCVTAHLVLRYF